MDSRLRYISIAIERAYNRAYARSSHTSITSDGMNSLDELRNELSSLSELIKVQIESGMNADELNASHFAVVNELIATCKEFASPDVLSLTKLINASPFSHSQKKDLAALVDGMRKAPKSKKSSNQTQHCFFFENLIDTPRMRDLRCTPMTRMSRALTIAEVARMLKLHKPCERTLFRMVQILAWTEQGSGEWDQATVFAWMDKLQIFVKATSTRTKVADVTSVVVDYPMTANGLPADMQALYAEIGGIPPELDLPMLDTILSDKNMRGGRGKPGSSKKAEPAWLKKLSPSEQEEARNVIASSCKTEPPTCKTEPTPCKSEPGSSSSNERNLESLASRLKSEQLLRSSCGPKKKKQHL